MAGCKNVLRMRTKTLTMSHHCTRPRVRVSRDECDKIAIKLRLVGGSPGHFNSLRHQQLVSHNSASSG